MPHYVKHLLNIIPDTSYLLGDDTSNLDRGVSIPLKNKLPAPVRALSWPFRTAPKVAGNIFSWLITCEDLPVTFSERTVEFTYIILDEVKKEILGLHSDHDRKAPTGRAKEVLRRIYSSYHTHEDVAANYPVIPLVEPIVGLDSQTDHAILSAAVAYSDSTIASISCVLTNDTGMKLELTQQRLRFGKRVCSQDEMSDVLKEHSGRIAAYLLNTHKIGRIL
jgi:hypothetical protein